MYRGLIYFGRRGIAIHAISGLDIALWDIKGKALGKPVYELLGDATARPGARLRLDADAGHDGRGDGRGDGAPRAQNFTAVKLGWGPLGKDPGHDVDLAAAAKRRRAARASRS